MKQTFEEFADGAIGIVEATPYEAMLIKEELARSGRGKLTFDPCGYFVEVGECAGSPVCVSMESATFQGSRVIFYDACSRIVDHDMVRDWFDKNLPDSALVHEGKANNTDAMNFLNIFRYKEN